MVKLILNKIVDNFYLSSYLAEELGNFLITRLKDDSASGVEKKFALKYLNKINAEVSGKIDEGEWEKIVI